MGICIVILSTMQLSRVISFKKNPIYLEIYCIATVLLEKDEADSVMALELCVCWLFLRYWEVIPQGYNFNTAL